MLISLLDHFHTYPIAADDCLPLYDSFWLWRLDLIMIEIVVVKSLLTWIMYDLNFGDAYSFISLYKF